jgi:Raf kinase inhibitor-like YbhB/YbcL family protein
MRHDTTTRRAVIGGAVALVAGCVGGDDGVEPDDGGTPTNEANPATGEVNSMGELTLASPAFDHCERIPDAVEPTGKVWDHWIVWNVPPGVEAIPKGWEPTDAEEGTNDHDEVGYGGPNPPDSEHRYRFKLFALDATLDLPTGTDAAALGRAMNGHILAETQLDGTYPA